MRTELSNLNKFVVHFFDARQRNEPKKTRMGEDPHVPPVVACYTQKRIRVFAKRTRFLPSADFAFAASTRTAKTEGFLRKKGIFLVGARIARPFRCATNYFC